MEDFMEDALLWRIAGNLLKSVREYENMYATKRTLQEKLWTLGMERPR